MHSFFEYHNLLIKKSLKASIEWSGFGMTYITGIICSLISGSYQAWIGEDKLVWDKALTAAKYGFLSFLVIMSVYFLLWLFFISPFMMWKEQKARNIVLEEEVDSHELSKQEPANELIKDDRSIRNITNNSGVINTGTILQKAPDRHVNDTLKLQLLSMVDKDLPTEILCVTTTEAQKFAAEIRGTLEQEGFERISMISSLASSRPLTGQNVVIRDGCNKIQIGSNEQ